jgi:hypothetical protein
MVIDLRLGLGLEIDRSFDARFDLGISSSSTARYDEGEVVEEKRRANEIELASKLALIVAL